MITADPASPVSAPTHELVRDVLQQTRELIRIELALARDDLEADIEKAKRSGLWAGIGIVFGSAMLAALVFALVVGLGGTAMIALAVAGVLALFAGAAGLAAYQILPRKPLERTRARLESEVNQLKEHVA
jgi:hypothetical protein